MKETTLAERFDPGSSAVLIIDIQNDYVHPEGSASKRGNDVTPVVAMIPRIHTLIEEARVAGVPLFFVRNAHGPNTDSETWKSRGAWDARGGPSRIGSWGADWYEVEPTADDVVIDKYRYDAFLGTPLELMLRARRVKTVVCAGTATNVCVESTMRAAFMRDFYVLMVTDCCAGSDPVLHEGSIENIRRHFGITAKLDQLVAAWASKAKARLPTATEGSTLPCAATLGRTNESRSGRL